MNKYSGLCRAGAAVTLTLMALPPAHAADAQGWTVTIGVGPQIVPKYPGSGDVALEPYPAFSFRHTGEPIKFGAPGDSPGISLFSVGGFEIGPVANLGQSRKPKDVGLPVHKVDSTLEAGGYAQFYLTPSVRVRGELRQGLGGHDGLIGNVGADFIVRDDDHYIFSMGPRYRYSDGRYQRAYFGVTPQDAVASGLPIFRPSGGSQAVGVNSGLLYQFTYHWGVSAYARYDRLIGAPADSPLVRRSRGSRDQFSTGAALTYTFDIGKLF